MDPYEFFLRGGLPRINKTNSLGSGVIIDQKGHILTNHHVISDASVIEILFAQSKHKISAVVVGSDPKTDLALLKVTTNLPLTPLDLGNSDTLRIGDVVLAIGNPLGYAHTVTSGIISAKGRVIGTGPYDDFLQTDASIHAGNSGGPLLDLRGRVIGINTAISTEGQGIGFAIPVNLAKRVIRDLLRHGKVIRPWLGVIGKNILSRDDIESSGDAGGVYGVIISNIIVDSPAQKSGLQIGDLVMQLGSDKVNDMNHLQRMLVERSPSDRVAMRIYRRGRGFLNLNVELGETPKVRDLPTEKDLF